MAEFDSEEPFKKYRKLKVILVILLPIFVIACLYFWYMSDDIDLKSGSFLILALMDIGIIIGLLTKEYYKWLIVFIALILLSFILKSMKIFGFEPVSSYGFGGISTIAFFSTFAFFRRYRHLPFLRYIGSSSNIVLWLFSIGILFKVNHWPAGSYFLGIGIFTYFPLLFAIIFTLPASNYADWEISDRKAYLGGIIGPLIFFFLLSSVIFIFPEIWSSIINLPIKVPWGMVPVNVN
jgi:hypothetical protein